MKFRMLDILSHKLPLLNLPLREGSRYNQVPVSSSSEPPKVDKNLYVTEKDYKSNVKKLQQVVGLLSYVAHKFRFEALYHVNVLAQYQLYPTEEVMRWANELTQYF
ncbi:transposon Ty1-H Gag-Pol polyprotein [Kluyveromyces marxianus]|nr:transposon Ty1-H Gag-Pol polyprotein [Kluyveromyces marxianus]